jgi:hypothetical protein
MLADWEAGNENLEVGQALEELIQDCTDRAVEIKADVD